MYPPLEIKSKYAREALCSTSLEDLPDEQWKLIENFENYAISNYGRVKSLERNTLSFNGRERNQPELIMKLIFVKQFNYYLNRSDYNVHCTLSFESKKYRKSIGRLVYFHFVEKFDLSDRSIVISFKDNDKLNVHFDNLEKISVSTKRLRTYESDRARTRRVDYIKPVSQYTVSGKLVADYETIYEAERVVGVGCESIQDVINKEFLTAGGFRWFLKDYQPKSEDFIVKPKSQSSEKQFNELLWEKLGKPPIDLNNPPACLNLSLKDLPGEEWRAIPYFEDSFAVSNKGRVKNLGGWTSGAKKFFLQERILSQNLDDKYEKKMYLYVVLLHKGKIYKKTTTRLLYYCFVKEFDIKNRKNVVINRNEPFWDIDITKLSLRPVNSALKKK
ncbi:NUMOD4 domain-containing protein [Flavobacterium sp.]|uniref:NUMOD4 domain-containing protein n=1 Tax=Flavobacterium sp. TaxID=239 RepID=UPI00261DB6EC|nr:NUMOD4 domain-containing protein [Flavobacterium sp.]MDD2986148.1 NUMOD4 domain-containing protein [Flavobacterium sp.]